MRTKLVALCYWHRRMRQIWRLYWRGSIWKSQRVKWGGMKTWKKMVVRRYISSSNHKQTERLFPIRVLTVVICKLTIESASQSRYLNYDPQILCNWSKSRPETKVVIAIQDTEAFDTVILSDLVSLLAYVKPVSTNIKSMLIGWSLDSLRIAFLSYFYWG